MPLGNGIRRLGVPDNEGHVVGLVGFAELMAASTDQLLEQLTTFLQKPPE